MTKTHVPDTKELFLPLVQAVEQASLRAPLRTFPPTLRLTEQLRLCLLALESRYPSHVIDINEAVCGSQPLGAEGWRACDLIELFQSTVPQLLCAPAQLVVTPQQRGIYLLDHADDTPALRIYCGLDGEKLPAYRGTLATRRDTQAPRQAEVLGETELIAST